MRPNPANSWPCFDAGVLRWANSIPEWRTNHMSTNMYRWNRFWIVQLSFGLCHLSLSRSLKGDGTQKDESVFGRSEPTHCRRQSKPVDAATRLLFFWFKTGLRGFARRRWPQWKHDHRSSEVQLGQMCTYSQYDILLNMTYYSYWWN